MTAAIRFRDWQPPADTVTPLTPWLLPADEPVSVGEPPVAPTLVSVLRVGLPRRSVRCASGWRITAPLDLVARPRMTVTWDGVTKADRDAVLAFLRDEVGHRAGAFGVRLDGPASELTTVRPLEDARDEWIHKHAYRVTIEVEALLASAS